jgi:predicted GIY-YIG superfamily endonuclease
VPPIGRRDRRVPEGLPHGPAIYAFRNRADGRLYIGKSFKATRRIRAHLNLLGCRKHPNRRLQQAYDKHGPEAF